MKTNVINKPNIARVVLGAIYCLAAISKLRNFGEFDIFVSRLNLPLIGQFSFGLCSLVIAIELALGFCLLIAEDIKGIAAISVCLMLSFTAFQAVLPLIVSGVPGCPCIKVPLLQELDKTVTYRIIRNLALLLISFYCWLSAVKKSMGSATESV